MLSRQAANDSYIRDVHTYNHSSRLPDKGCQLEGDAGFGDWYRRRCLVLHQSSLPCFIIHYIYCHALNGGATLGPVVAVSRRKPLPCQPQRSLDNESTVTVKLAPPPVVCPTSVRAPDVCWHTDLGPGGLCFMNCSVCLITLGWHHLGCIPPAPPETQLPPERLVSVAANDK